MVKTNHIDPHPLKSTIATHPAKWILIMSSIQFGVVFKWCKVSFGGHYSFYICSCGVGCLWWRGGVPMTNCKLLCCYGTPFLYVIDVKRKSVSCWRMLNNFGNFANKYRLVYNCLFGWDHAVRGVMLRVTRKHGGCRLATSASGKVNDGDLTK